MMIRERSQPSVGVAPAGSKRFLLQIYGGAKQETLWASTGYIYTTVCIWESTFKIILQTTTIPTLVLHATDIPVLYQQYYWYYTYTCTISTDFYYWYYTYTCTISTEFYYWYYTYTCTISTYLLLILYIYLYYINSTTDTIHTPVLYQQYYWYYTYTCTISTVLLILYIHLYYINILLLLILYIYLYYINIFYNWYYTYTCTISTYFTTDTIHTPVLYQQYYWYYMYTCTISTVLLILYLHLYYINIF